MVTLIILDGFGIRKDKFGNAIVAAGTPYLDKLKKRYSYTQLDASGEAVGLPQGIMGNSEAGHLTLGTGRVNLQDLSLIDSEIKNGKFFNNPALEKAMRHAEKYGTLQIMGLLSDGRVHSDINHLFAILDYAKNFKIDNIYIHAFTDGRDTGICEAKSFINKTQEKIKGTNASIASIAGRVLLDREQRWDRVKKLYELLVNGKGQNFKSAIEAIEYNYKNGITDEFIEPAIINPKATFKANDSVIFFNYRSDRAREITFALTDKNFDKFKVKPLKNLLFTPMEEYSDQLKGLNTLYPPRIVQDNLAAIISKNGLTQFHIAETTKYAHVTFFFNGGNETPYKGETRKLIESIDTPDFSYYPKMKALEITEHTLEAIASAKYDFIVVNYSNADMLGHTGNFQAAKEAIACIDKQAYAVALATLMAGGECVICADHGNAEDMIDKNGNKLTTHTTNKVPCILVSEKRKVRLKKNCGISNIAPTILKLLGLKQPEEMSKPLF